jgi:hypothetical protein
MPGCRGDDEYWCAQEYLHSSGGRVSEEAGRRAAAALVRRALELGSTDNATAVVLLPEWEDARGSEEWLQTALLENNASHRPFFHAEAPLDGEEQKENLVGGRQKGAESDKDASPRVHARKEGIIRPDEDVLNRISELTVRDNVSV